MGLEWPEHAAKIKPDRQAALEAVGQELEQAMRSISTRQTPAGPRGNDVLFDEVLANYTGHLDAFDTALQATQAAFVQQHASSLGRNTSFDRAIISVYVDNNTVARRTIDTPQREVANVQALLRTIAGWEQAPLYKTLFEEQFANATPIPSSQRAAILSAIEQELRRLQAAFDERVKSDMTTGGLKDATLRLAGSRKLVESFVALGMPQALANDDLMHSLLYSNQALIDDQQVIAAYTRSISATSETTDLTINPRVALIATANKRLVALGQLLTRYTDAINAKTYSEPISLINDARSRMRLALASINVREQPSDGRQLFVPLIKR